MSTGANVQVGLDLVPRIDPSTLASGISQIQEQFSKLKLPKDLQSKIGTNFDDAIKALEKFQDLATKKTKTKSDILGMEKAEQQATAALEKIQNKIKGLSKEDLWKSFKPDASLFSDVETQITDLGNKLKQAFSQSMQDSDNSFNLDVLKQKLEALKKYSKIDFSGVFKGLTDALASGDTSNLDEKITTMLERLKNLRSETGTTSQEVKTAVANLLQSFTSGDFSNAETQIKILENALQSLGKDTNGAKMSQPITEFLRAVLKLETGNDTINELKGKLKDLAQQKIDIKSQEFEKFLEEVRNAGGDVDQFIAAYKRLASETLNTNRAQAQFNQELDQLKHRVQYFFGLTNAVQLLRRAMRETLETVKELDASMTQTAVVTDFTVGDMWKQLPQYTATAKEFGVTIKGVYDVMTLYYQQGLDQNSAWQLGTETLKLARIAGLDYAEATDRRHKSYAA